MGASSIRGSIQAVIACWAGAMALGGCSSAPPPQVKADYSQTLDRYYEGRPVCLWPDTVKFPVEDATPDQIDERGFEALRDAGLLVRLQAGNGAAQGSYTYDLSPEGRSALDPDIFNKGAGNFCYGQRKVVSIDAAQQNSPTTELVDFHYSVEQPAAWAKEYTIQMAFPQVVSELSGVHKGEATLLDTTDGWEVSGTPATIVPMTAAPRTSALAKAMALLHLNKQAS